MADSDKKWIYRSIHGDFTLVVRGTSRRPVKDQQGNETWIMVPPIKLKFVAGSMTINDTMAKRFNCDLESLVEMVEGQPSFGKTFHCIHSPEKTATPEEIEEIENAKKSSGPTVKRGTRSRAK